MKRIRNQTLCSVSTTALITAQATRNSPKPMMNRQEAADGCHLVGEAVTDRQAFLEF